MKFKIPDTPEELFRQGGQNLSMLNKWLPFILAIFILLFIVLTSFYSVEQDEVGIIRRFGAYHRTTPPGLHWKFPMGIEKLDRVPVTRVFKEEFGFRTLQAGVNTRYSNQQYLDESLMLTGDLNVLDVSWVVQYKINDPVAVLFNVDKPRDTLRDMSEAVMRQVIGDYSVTEALTTRKIEISQEAREKLQHLLDKLNIGITVTQLELQDVTPPDPVQASFNEVNEAEQERDKIINQAWEEYNKIIPKARGEAEKIIREAEGYETARVKRAEGDAEKFVETWNAYKNAKDVTRRRLYLETMEEVLTEAGNVFVFNPDSNQVLPLLNIKEGAVK